MKIVTNMSASSAKKFFMKPESYFNFDLPKYFNFESILKLSDSLLAGNDFSGAICKGKPYLPKSMENVDYVIMHNKDGKYAWRPFELIHPLLYVKLVNDICDNSNWKEIKARLKTMHSNSKIKCCSMPCESSKKGKDRRDTIMKWWTDYEQESIATSIEFSLMACTDITNCYPSIYTHAISWAMHGKEKAKETVNDLSYIGNLIDVDIEQMRYGQTNGIPQGSVLMDFIAEIILGYCDEELTKKLNTLNITNYKILRYRDDYRIFTNSSSDLEKILKSIAEVLARMNFKLNTSKTFTTSDIITKSVKEDKIERFTKSEVFEKLSLQKQLFLIDDFSKKYPNSGSLSVLLTNTFNNTVKSMKKKPKEYRQIISIIADIMYNNPRTYPICVAILSRMFKLIKNKTEINNYVDLIINKFKSLPNTTYLEIWLQRITIPLDRNKEYSEGSICEKIYNKNSTIWNSDWVRDNIKNVFDENLIINESEIENLELEIANEEVDAFAIFHES